MRSLSRQRGFLSPGQIGIWSGGGVFSPDQIPGLVLWADASQITGLADTDPIDSVTDLSGNGNTLTAPTSGKRPLYRVISGVPWMRFDGVDDRLTAAGAILPSDARCTILMVIKPTAEAVVGFCMGQFAAGQAGRTAFSTNQVCQGTASSGNFNPFINGATDGACTGGGAGLPVHFAYTTSPPSVIGYTNVGGSEGAKVRLNGVQKDSFTCSSMYTGGPFSLGRDHGEGQGAYDGDIGEVLIYDPEVTSAQLTRLESYLIAKWPT